MRVGSSVRKNTALGLAMASGIAALFCALMNFIDLHRFVCRTYRIKSEKLRGLEKPLRLLLISDLHGCTYGKENRRLLAAIKAKQPDGILLAGDILTKGNPRKQETAIRFVNAIGAQYPVFYAFGNHESELLTWKKEQDGTKDLDFLSALNQTGVHVLRNSATALPGANITIYGLELDRCFYRNRNARMQEDCIEKKLGSCDSERFTILIAHHPEYFHRYADWGADLVVSGHNHGGIVRLPFLGGVISTSLKLFPKYDGGVYQRKNTIMVLSRGLGTHSVPLRLFNPSELVEIVLDSPI